MAETSPEEIFRQAVRHHQAGELEQARPLYDQVLIQRPDWVDALHWSAILEYRLGSPDAAVERLRRAISHDEQRVDSHYALGIILRNSGRAQEAVPVFIRALQLKPDHAEACNDLGIALASLNRFDEAIAIFRRALTIRADFGDALNNLGSALASAERYDEATAAFRQAIAMRPTDAVAYSNLGHSLWSVGKFDEALAACQRAIFLNPNYADGYNHLGLAQKDLGLVQQALVSFRKAVELRPGDVRLRDALIACTNYEAVDLPALAEEMRLWNQIHSAPLKSLIPTHDNDRDPDRRLRIGYVSSDFGVHVSEYFLDPLLKNHDHERFEIFVYAQVSQPDDSTQRFQKYADQWRITGNLDDPALADQIRQDKIDILVDLKLHTVGNRLLAMARKPAPVQVSWLGYPGTSGLDTIDWRLTDRFLEPQDGAPTVAAASAERPAYLPDCFWCYDPIVPEPHVNPLPAKTANFITFGSLNALIKVNNTTLDLWLATLSAVPNSRLLMLAPAVSARRRVTDKFRAAGIDQSRIEFVDRLPRPLYLRTYHRIDICLDTYPCSGHSTSCDALWMGVPIVTLVSPTVMGRATFSQLSNLNLQHLAAHRPEDFPVIAAKLAGDIPALAQLRETLRPRMTESPLMDGPRFARGVETAYRKIWQHWLQSPG